MQQNTKLRWEPVSINDYYIMTRSCIKHPTPNKEASLGHVNWGFVYPESSYKISKDHTFFVISELDYTMDSKIEHFSLQRFCRVQMKKTYA